jgi:DNA-binding transcriptional LysR family regulator
MRVPRIETFDLNLLKIFDALFQHGSVNSAATQIGVSPSAISHALGRLRHTFGDELFVKGPGGMVPTARAAEIAERVAVVLHQVHSVLGEPEFEPEKADRHFKLRCNDYVGLLLLPHVVEYLRNNAPRITLTVETDYGKGMADELDAGVVDLLVGTFGRIPERFESEVLLSDRWVWVLRANHSALSYELTPEHLLQLPQLVIATNDAGRSIDGVVTEAGLERLVVADKMFLGNTTMNSRYSTQVKGMMIINNAWTAPAIIANSDLVALLPERLANMMSRLYDLKIVKFDKEPYTFEHRMIWHRKHGTDPAKNWLRSVFRNSVGKVDYDSP